MSDDPNRKKNIPVKSEPAEPELTNIAGPPPDPRGASESTNAVDAKFDPAEVSIESNAENLSDAEGAEPGPLAESGAQQPTPEMHINKPKGPIKRLRSSKKFWFRMVFVLLAAAAILWFIQPTRNWLVNALGQKAPVLVSTRTLAEPGEPGAILQKAKVTIDGQSQETNSLGRAEFMASYGQTEIVVEKSGYETARYSTQLDFNPFFGLIGNSNSQQQQFEMQLKTTGLLLRFKVLDWLTELPVTNGDIAVGDVVTAPDDQGMVTIKVPPTDRQVVDVVAKVAGYATKEVELTIQEDPLQQVALVPAGKLYFISNRTGQLGIYSSGLDGSGVAEVIEPSAKETAGVDFSPSPGGNHGVLASTREGKRDASNILLQKLYVVNLQDGSLSAVDEGVWFDFIDWSGDTMVYLAASVNGERRLSSVNVANGQRTVLDSALVFGDARVALGQVVYISSNVQNASMSAGNFNLNVLPVVGGTKKNLGSAVSVLTQTDFDKVVFKTSDNLWHEYNLNTSSSNNASAPASVSRSYLANASADGQLRLLTDKVDGTNTLIVKSVATGKETRVYGSNNLSRPIHWVGNLIALRTASGGATANGIIAPTMTTPKQLGSVTPSASGTIGFY